MIRWICLLELARNQVEVQDLKCIIFAHKAAIEPEARLAEKGSWDARVLVSIPSISLSLILPTNDPRKTPIPIKDVLLDLRVPYI